MRWAVPFRVDPRSVIDKYHLYDRTLNRNRAKMRGAGSPCTIYTNPMVTLYGTEPENLTKCYCWEKTSEVEETDIKSQPNRDHFLCMGTGYLQGYGKYGYEDIVISTPSLLTFSSSSIAVAQDSSGEPDRISIMSTSTLESFETENFSLTNFKEVEFFLAKDATDPDTNRIKYYYSVNGGSNWVELQMVTYTTTKLANKQAINFYLNENSAQIKFKVELQKRYSNSPSPRFNSLRFRYRSHPTLRELDPRFEIDIPAFLAAREQVRLEVTQGEYGWKTTRPMRWWVLPETHVQESDIIMFLQGEFQDQKYEVKNLTEHTHGPSLQILHRDFESAFLRDNKDIIRIIDLLI